MLAQFEMCPHLSCTRTIRCGQGDLMLVALDRRLWTDLLSEHSVPRRNHTRSGGRNMAGHESVVVESNSYTINKLAIYREMQYPGPVLVVASLTLTRIYHHARDGSRRMRVYASKALSTHNHVPS